MEQKVSASQNAAVANIKSYNDLQAEKYIDGAPHLKHELLRKLYRKLVLEIYNTACTSVSRPRALDLGAGEGSATLFLLELGAEVTVVDISENQLESLKKQTNLYSDRLSVYCGDVNNIVEEINAEGTKYDIVIANALLNIGRII